MHFGFFPRTGLGNFQQRFRSSRSVHRHPAAAPLALLARATWAGIIASDFGSGAPGLTASPLHFRRCPFEDQKVLQREADLEGSEKPVALRWSYGVSAFPLIFDEQYPALLEREHLPTPY